MYWIVFAFFTCFETLTDLFLSFWFPFYYEVSVEGRGNREAFVICLSSEKMGMVRGSSLVWSLPVQCCLGLFWGVWGLCAGVGVSGTTICALCVCDEGVALIWGGFVCVGRYRQSLYFCLFMIFKLLLPFHLYIFIIIIYLGFFFGGRGCRTKHFFPIILFIYRVIWYISDFYIPADMIVHHSWRSWWCCGCWARRPGAHPSCTVSSFTLGSPAGRMTLITASHRPSSRATPPSYSSGPRASTTPPQSWCRPLLRQVTETRQVTAALGTPTPCANGRLSLYSK